MTTELPEELERLLAAQVLWPSDLRKLYILAYRHGVEVCVLRRDLNDWAAGWREVGRVGE